MVRSQNELRQFIYTNRHFYEIQSAMHEYMQLCKTSCKLDLITIFSLRPPEFITNFDMVGKHYRWFNVSSKPLKDNLVLEFLNEYLKTFAWIDSMKCQILFQKRHYIN